MGEKRLILEVPVVAQPTSFTCGPASLKAVLAYHGRRVSIRRLRALCGTTHAGTDHAKLAAAARALGARVLAKSEGTLADLRAFLQRDRPVIVGWWSMDPGQVDFDPRWDLATRQRNDCGHYSVVMGLSSDRVWLMDPQEAGTTGKPMGRRAMSRDHFLSVWYDTDTSRYRLVRRWLVVVQ